MKYVTPPRTPKRFNMPVTRNQVYIPIRAVNRASAASGGPGQPRRFGGGTMHKFNSKRKIGYRIRFRGGISQTQTQKKKRKTKAAGRRGGVFTGYFSKPRNFRKNPVEKFAKGALRSQEVTGTITDPNIVYLAHSTICFDQALACVVQAVIRRVLYELLSIDVADPLTSISPSNTNTTTPILQLNYTANGSNFNVQHFMTPTTSINSIVTTFAPTFRQFAQGGAPNSSDNAVELMNIEYLINKQDSTGSNLANIGTFSFSDYKVHFFSTSSIKIQNRTVGADGSADAENVSSTPVVGTQITFKGAVPKPRGPWAPFDGDTKLFNTMDFETGVNLIRGAQLSNEFNDRPLPSFFGNATKSSQIRLDPGEIKQDKYTNSYNMGLLYFLKKLRFNKGDATAAASAIAQNLYYGIGTSTMYAIEEVINVSSTQNIRLAYEVQRNVGAYLTRIKPRSTVATFTQQTRNNPQPPV